DEPSSEPSSEPSNDPSAEPSAPSGTPITGAEISAFGDSMLYVAAPGIHDRLPGISIDAESNRQWPQVAAAIEGALANGSLRDVVLIAAGTNAGARDTALINSVLDKIGP